MNGYAIYETPVCLCSTYKGVRKKRVKCTIASTM